MSYQPTLENTPSTLKKYRSVFRKLWLLLIVAISASPLVVYSRNICHEYIYPSAHTKENSSDSEQRSCTNPRSLSAGTSGYVVEHDRVYYRKSDTSNYGDCVGGIGSYSSAGRSVCPFGTTSVTVTTNHFFPLELSPKVDKLRILNEDYAGTSDAVYYKQLVILGANPLQHKVVLRALPLPVGKADGGSSARLSDYAVYGKQVFYKGETVEGADAESFQALHLENPGKDSYDYHFTELARDKSRLYWEGRMLDDSKPATIEVVDSNYIKAGDHLWHVGTGSVGLVLNVLPESLGGGFYRSRYTSPSGESYSRIQRSDELSDGRHKFVSLPLRMAEGDEFRVLPAGCPVRDGFMTGHPGLYCDPFEYLPVTEFGRTKSKIFLADKPVSVADVNGFQILSVANYNYGGFSNAQAIDGKRIYLFGDDWSRSVAIQGQVLGPIPSPYGDFLLLADAANIYDLTGWHSTLGYDDDLCRYEQSSSTRGLKLLERAEERNGHPYIVLGNKEYQYVFYANPKGKENPGHVINQRTGQRLRLAAKPSLEEHCGPL